MPLARLCLGRVLPGRPSARTSGERQREQNYHNGACTVGLADGARFLRDYAVGILPVQGEFRRLGFSPPWRAKAQSTMRPRTCSQTGAKCRLCQGEDSFLAPGNAMRSVWLLLLLLPFAPGCLIGNPRFEPSGNPVVLNYKNPLPVPSCEPDLIWEAMCDVIHDYFKIARGACSAVRRHLLGGPAGYVSRSRLDALGTLALRFGRHV